MIEWFITILTAVGSSVITCVVMEAYHQRRASEVVSEWEYDWSEPDYPQGEVVSDEWEIDEINMPVRYSPGEERIE